MSPSTLPAAPLPASREARLDRWLDGYVALGRALAEGRIPQEAWREGMDRAFEALDLEALKARIGFPARLAERSGLAFRGCGEAFRALAVDGGPAEQGPEPARRVITKLAWVLRGGCVPPHGHLNMVSSFLVLSGRFRVRQYDKVGAGPGRLWIRPRLDEVQGPGAWSTVTDGARNVHWLTALDDDASLFTTKVLELRPGAPYAGRIPLDLDRAEAEPDGTLRVPVVDAREVGAPGPLEG
ncbi:MAG: hypothetical protein U0P81_06550 [Holophagaceae bacterium]